MAFDLMASNCDVLLQIQRTPLMLAAENGHVFVVEYLVERGANINARNKVTCQQPYFAVFSCAYVSYQVGQTALYLAAYKGHPAIVAYLCSRGADVAIPDEVCSTSNI